MENKIIEVIGRINQILQQNKIVLNLTFKPQTKFLIYQGCEVMSSYEDFKTTPYYLVKAMLKAFAETLKSKGFNAEVITKGKAIKVIMNNRSVCVVKMFNNRVECKQNALYQQVLNDIISIVQKATRIKPAINDDVLVVLRILGECKEERFDNVLQFKSFICEKIRKKLGREIGMFHNIVDTIRFIVDDVVITVIIQQGEVKSITF